MKFECFNGIRNCDYCGSCHSEFKARTSDEKRQVYNQALDDFVYAYYKYCEEQYGIFADDEMQDMLKVKKQLIK